MAVVAADPAETATNDPRRFTPLPTFSPPAFAERFELSSERLSATPDTRPTAVFPACPCSLFARGVVCKGLSASGYCDGCKWVAP